MGIVADFFPQDKPDLREDEGFPEFDFLASTEVFGGEMGRKGCVEMNFC